MLPREPFQKCRSERPSWRHTAIVASVEIGAHSVDALYHETGIERTVLRSVLSDLEQQRYITRIDGRYHRPSNRGAIVPPANEEVQVGY
jgi:predicted Rossmann fold nucleotide-binding protein DprA/Smf involved in DNA uptake